ncbi:hypothetical protein XENTR_v10021529 [Xenopus tropicalis]|nr:hypothetical protein XENTR_v10021529 [Xenopus tropicalis]
MYMILLSPNMQMFWRCVVEENSEILYRPIHMEPLLLNLVDFILQLGINIVKFCLYYEHMACNFPIICFLLCFMYLNTNTKKQLSRKEN